MAPCPCARHRRGSSGLRTFYPQRAHLGVLLLHPWLDSVEDPCSRSKPPDRTFPRPSCARHPSCLGSREPYSSGPDQAELLPLPAGREGC
ncbi:hypothetical protein HYQ46_004159 [Verticillium longisporum]|nr:hypothetical protein HYQ46_004159 [Verticillium longisporum]